MDLDLDHTYSENAFIFKIKQQITKFFHFYTIILKEVYISFKRKLYIGFIKYCYIYKL